MSPNVTLVGVFLDEVVHYLSVWEDLGTTDEAREEARSSLAQACELLDDDELAERARSIVNELKTAPVPAGRKLATFARELRALVEAAAGRQLAAGDTPRRRGRSFDTGEFDLLRTFFRDEAQDGLDAIARHIIEAGGNGLTSEQFDDVMRRAHGLKGAAGTVGLRAFAEIAHNLEDALDRVRRGRVAWSPDLADKFVETVDAMREYACLIGDDAASKAALDRVKHGLRQLARSRDSSAVTLLPTKPATADAGSPDDADDRRTAERRRDEPST